MGTVGRAVSWVEPPPGAKAATGASPAFRGEVDMLTGTWTVADGGAAPLGAVTARGGGRAESSAQIDTFGAEAARMGVGIMASRSIGAGSFIMWTVRRWF